MTAFNVVRFRVKAGDETAFVEGHRKLTAQARKILKGLKSVNLVKTGDSTFCFVGEWRTFKSIVNAREHMIGMLDQFRPSWRTSVAGSASPIRFPARAFFRSRGRRQRRRPSRSSRR